MSLPKTTLRGALAVGQCRAGASVLARVRSRRRVRTRLQCHISYTCVMAAPRSHSHIHVYERDFGPAPFHMSWQIHDPINGDKCDRSAVQSSVPTHVHPYAYTRTRARAGTHTCARTWQDSLHARGLFLTHLTGQAWVLHPL